MYEYNRKRLLDRPGLNEIYRDRWKKYINKQTEKINQAKMIEN